MTLSLNSGHYSSSTKALINRIGSPYRHNQYGSDYFVQASNTYQVAVREIENQSHQLNDHTLGDYVCHTKSLHSYDVLIPTQSKYKDFIAAQVVNPLAKGNECGQGFDGYEPFQEKMVEDFLQAAEDLILNPITPIQDSDSLAFPIGMQLYKSGHTMFMEINKVNENQLEVVFFNTAGGCLHQSAGKNKIRAIKYTLTNEQFSDPTRKDSIRNLMQFLRRENQGNIQKENNKLMREFYRLLDLAFGLQEPNAEKISNKSHGRSYRHQVGGNCSAKSTSVWAHNKFKESTQKNQINKSDYYKFKIALLTSDKYRLHNSQSNLKGIRMKVFFKCFRFLNNFYIRAEKRDRWILTWIIRSLFMYTTKNEKRLKLELTRSIDRKIKICQTKIASLDKSVAPVA